MKNTNIEVNVNGIPVSYTLELNAYQRDNLLQLLNICGSSGKGIEPFTIANNGDWLKEIAILLTSDYGGKLEEQSKPNMDAGTYERMLGYWKQSLSM
jgi:hypothetical protein